MEHITKCEEAETGTEQHLKELLTNILSQLDVKVSTHLLSLDPSHDMTLAMTNQITLVGNFLLTVLRSGLGPGG